MHDNFLSHHPELINPAKTQSFSKPKKPAFPQTLTPTFLRHSTKMADYCFTKGSKVEVSSDDDGFKGAWYVATIIEGPKLGKCLIQYETLVEDEEGSEPLTERVQVSYIRPLPPVTADGSGCFEVNDIVDAFHRDGWWTGVVARVVEGSGKFLVTFENPQDEIEFSRSELRIHMEWIDAKWEKPQKKSVMVMTFYKGAAVEVSLQKKEFRNGWYLGTILRASENNNFLVDYQCSGVGKKPVNRKVNVDSLQIRPSPPHLEDKEFVLMDEVEAYYDFCWWSGVINRHLEDGRYVVLVKHANEEKEFCRSDLRPRMDWIDGKWIIASQETKQVAGLCDRSIKWSRQKRRARKPQPGRYCDSAKGKKGIAMEDNVNEIVEKKCIAEEFEMSVKEVKGAPAENPCETPGKVPSKFMKDQEQRIADPEIQEIDGSSNTRSNQKKKRGRPLKSLPEKQIGDGGIRAEFVSREMVVKDCVMNKVELNAGTDHLKLMTNDDKPREDLFQLSGKDSAKFIIADKKLLRGFHRHNDILSIRDIPLAENDNQANEKVARKRVKRLKDTVSNGQGQRNTTVDSECQIQDCQDVSRGKTSESNEMFPEKNDDEILADGIFADMNDDQPLLTWFKGPSPVGSLGQIAKAIDKKDENDMPPSAIATNDSMDSSRPQKTNTNDSDSGAMLARNLNQCSEASDREGELGTPSAAIVISNSVDNNQSLPFVKCSPVWKTIESMEIFHKTPQKPHFSPLVNCNEDAREGLAIGQMVIFTNLVERTSKLRLSDSSSSIKRSLETLADLELHGFDVEAVRVRLNDLLLKKEREREFQCEYKNVENEITKSNLEKAEFQKEIDEIQLKMRVLAEKLAAVTSMKEMKELEISTLGSKLDAIGENIKSIQLDYEYM